MARGPRRQKKNEHNNHHSDSPRNINFSNNEINSISISVSDSSPPQYTRYSPAVSRPQGHRENRSTRHSYNRSRPETYQGKPKGAYRDINHSACGNQGKPKGENPDIRQCAKGNLGKPQGENPDIHGNCDDGDSRVSSGEAHHSQPKGKNNDM